MAVHSSEGRGVGTMAGMRYVNVQLDNQMVGEFATSGPVVQREAASNLLPARLD